MIINASQFGKCKASLSNKFEIQEEFIISNHHQTHTHTYIIRISTINLYV